MRGPFSLYIRALRDPYGGLQNPYFLELQQKNVAAGENCPYNAKPSGFFLSFREFPTCLTKSYSISSEFCGMIYILVFQEFPRNFYLFPGVFLEYCVRKF